MIWLLLCLLLKGEAFSADVAILGKFSITNDKLACERPVMVNFIYYARK